MERYSLERFCACNAMPSWMTWFDQSQIDYSVFTSFIATCTFKEFRTHNNATNDVCMYLLHKTCGYALAQCTPYFIAFQLVTMGTPCTNRHHMLSNSTSCTCKVVWKWLQWSKRNTLQFCEDNEYIQSHKLQWKCTPIWDAWKEWWSTSRWS